MAAILWDGELSFVSGKLLRDTLGEVREWADVVTVEPAELEALAAGFMALISPANAFDMRIARDVFRGRGLPQEGKYVYAQCAPCGHIVKIPL